MPCGEHDSGSSSENGVVCEAQPFGHEEYGLLTLRQPGGVNFDGED